MSSPPVAIAKALLVDFNAGLAAGTFSLMFSPRVGFGDFAEKLEDDALDTPYVDIVLPVRPSVRVAARFKYDHDVELTIGLRQKLTRAKRLPDGSMDMDEVSPLVDLFYELMDFCLPDDSYRTGERLTDVPTAVLTGEIDVVKLWDPLQLETIKQYTGIFRAGFKYREADT